MAMPLVSMIIPTHARPGRLHRLLQSIRRQDYPSQECELIVAQDGDDLETQAVVESFRADTTLPIRHVCHQRGSAAATRNLGASLARGEYLLFVDDDCEVTPTWTRRTVDVLERDPDIGQVASRIVGGSTRFFARCHDYARYYPSMKTQPGPRSFACGCAFGIRRSLFARLGGFDETILTGEDEDLGLRLQASGARTVYQPECVVCHYHDRVTLRGMLQRAYAWGLRGEVDRHLTHRGRATYGRFASSNPYFYLILAPFISLAVSLRIWSFSWRERMMPLYLPFIFCDKLAWCLATHSYLLAKGRRT